MKTKEFWLVQVVDPKRIGAKYITERNSLVDPFQVIGYDNMTSDVNEAVWFENKFIAWEAGTPYRKQYEVEMVRITVEMRIIQTESGYKE